MHEEGCDHGIAELHQAIHSMEHGHINVAKQLQSKVAVLCLVLGTTKRVNRGAEDLLQRILPVCKCPTTNSNVQDTSNITKKHTL